MASDVASSLPNDMFCAYFCVGQLTLQTNGLFYALLHCDQFCLFCWNVLQIYRWEKRDFNDMKFVLRVPKIPMPPPYQDGWTLEFDAPLTRPRHDLVVLMLTQVRC
jgi:hypothetical protein